MVDYTNLEQINQDALSAKIEKTKEFSCVIPFAGPASEQYLSMVLSIFLLILNKTNLFTFLEYCLKEMVMNGSKANSKRIYFREKGLKITEPADYAGGIKNFKADVFGNFSTYEQKHKDLSAVVKVQFKITETVFQINVVNNSILCREEKERIQERLKVADKFNSMAEVLTYGFDETEGAGFGLIIVILMLRKMNLDERVFSIKSSDKFTITSLSIPVDLISNEQGMLLANEITDEIASMPQFPEGILRLQQELADPNCDFHSIAEVIRQDPALTSEIIRIANSPVYMLPQKVEDVVTAVQMIGVKGVKNLVLSFGVNTVFKRKYKKEKIDEVMDHSFKVAVYGSEIARIKRLGNLKDDIYVAALLHDMGKIIVNSLQPELIQKLQKICETRHIPLTALENLTNGYNHSIIGALLAEKWNFPPSLIASIKYHHIPLETPDEYKTIVYTVYLANEFYYCLKGTRSYEDLNYKVLKFFAIEAHEKFMGLLGSVEAVLKDNK